MKIAKGGLLTYVPMTYSWGQIRYGGKVHRIDHAFKDWDTGLDFYVFQCTKISHRIKPINAEDVTSLNACPECWKQRNSGVDSQL